MIPGQRNKTQVHVGRFLVHMHHGGEDIFFAQPFRQESKGLAEKVRHLLGMVLGKLRRDGYQGVYKFDAVPAHPAAGCLDPVPDLPGVIPPGSHQVKVLIGAPGINVRIAFIALLGALMMGAQRLGCASLVFLKA